VKAAESLTVSDFEAHPVWQFVNNDVLGETMVKPVRKLPVVELTGKIVGTRVDLANGGKAWALIGNVNPWNPRKTEHLVTLSIERGGEWFHLARYHDFDYEERGAEALSLFLGLGVDEVFPISSDLRRYAEGDAAALVGSVLKEPRKRLRTLGHSATSMRAMGARAEIIAMALK